DGVTRYSTLGEATTQILAAAHTVRAGRFFAIAHGGHQEFQAIKAHLKDEKSGEDLQIVVAVDTEIHEHFMRNFQTTLVLYVTGSAL
ncbi:hypothetical protein, partial [Salmonella enterica]